LRPAERVLEAGCGGGALLPAYAAAVGPSGRVVGVDISPDQIAAAREACAGNAFVEATIADINALPCATGSFDALVAIQVIEYLADPLPALSELRRVSAAGARLVIVATISDTMFWNTAAPDLTTRILAAWRTHAPHQNLPAELRPLLEGAGFRLVRQAPVSIVNSAYHEDAFAYWLARLMVAYVTTSRLVDAEDAARWLQALEEAHAGSRFFFSSTPVLSLAIAA
ncbi:MAG: methyltransferase domain-containing protein, partial [Acetobacteraceae bacterium]|nr:methyltransferase domain-containing protein [Acetobacteraceae bacterium]